MGNPVRYRARSAHGDRARLFLLYHAIWKGASQFVDYQGHSKLRVTNKYLQATSNSKRLSQEDAILATGILPKTQNPS